MAFRLPSQTKSSNPYLLHRSSRIRILATGCTVPLAQRSFPGRAICRYRPRLVNAGSRRIRTIDALPMYKEMIVTGAWWDFVDTIAAHGIGGLLRTNKPRMRPGYASMEPLA